MTKFKITDFLRLYEDDYEHGEALRDTGFWGRAGAGVLFMSRNTGRILFPFRSGQVEQPHTWGTWGGAIDAGEHPAQAAAREAEEEAGYNAKPDDIIPLYVFVDPKGSGFKYYNFLVLVPSEFDPALNWETEDSIWTTFGKWPEPLHFGAKGLLNDKASYDTIEKYAYEFGQAPADYYQRKSSVANP